MSRTLNQSLLLTETVCGTNASDQAQKMNELRQSAIALNNVGLVVASGWGGMVDEGGRPIVGGSLGSASLKCPGGTILIRIPFELPSLVTGGANTMADKFLLSTKFILFGGPEALASGGGISTELAGKVSYQIETGSGLSELYSAHGEPPITYGVSATENVQIVGAWQEVTRRVTGNLPAAISPNAGETVDAEMIISLSELFQNATPSVSQGDLVTITTLNAGADSLPPYIGVLGFSLKIFNPISL